MKKDKPDLSIVISNYNTPRIVKKTLTTLFKHIKNITYEVIVIDDASRDRSAQIIKENFPRVKLIQNRRNLGYSKSYNKGTRVARGRYVLHLNSDARLTSKSRIDGLIAYMDRYKSIGIAGSKILKSDGTIDLPCKRSFPTIMNVFFQTSGLAFLFPKSKLFGNYYLTYLDPTKIQEVDCLMGAFMMIRSDVIKDIGLLDERFFIYGEDIDYCFRAKKNGWKIVYYPHVVTKHLHGGTTRHFSLKYIWMFHKAMFLYYEKHFRRRKNIFINALVYVGILIRFFLMVAYELLSLIKSRMITKIKLGEEK